jgi:hypothetical protein
MEAWGKRTVLQRMPVVTGLPECSLVAAQSERMLDFPPSNLPLLSTKTAVAGIDGKGRHGTTGHRTGRPETSGRASFIRDFRYPT